MTEDAPWMIRLHDVEGKFILEIPKPPTYPEGYPGVEHLVILHEGHVYQRDGYGYLDESDGEERFAYSMHSRPILWFENFIERPTWHLPEAP